MTLPKIGLVVSSPLVPIHMSPREISSPLPAFPETVHEAVLLVDHVTVAVPPVFTISGDMLMEPLATGVTHDDTPGEQKLGEEQVVMFVVEQLVLVCVIVWEPAPVQAHDCVQETVSTAPVPPEPVPVHCAVLLPGLVHEAVYVVDCEGETETLPEVAPPVEKLLPVQLVA